MKSTKQPPGTERYRDEQREEDDRPKVAGHQHWSDDPKRAMDEDDVDDSDIESEVEHAGMGRGEKPRKSKDREP